MQKQTNTSTVHKEGLGLRKQNQWYLATYESYPLIILLVSKMRLILIFPKFCDSYTINIDLRLRRELFRDIFWHDLSSVLIHTCFIYTYSYADNLVTFQLPEYK